MYLGFLSNPCNMKTTKIIGYIRVTTTEQDPEKNEAAILKYANDHNFSGKVQIVEETISGAKSWKKRTLSKVVDDLQKDDILIVPELSRLGRSLQDVLEVLNILSKKEVRVYSVKENFKLNGEDIQSKLMRTMLGLFAEIERDLIIDRTKEGLEAARKKGKQLGRPKGPGKSKLDDHREAIISDLKSGVTKAHIAKKHNVTPATLHNWLKRHKLNKVKPVLS